MSSDCKPCAAAAARAARGTSRWITFDSQTGECITDGEGNCPDYPNAAQALAAGRDAGVDLPGVRRL